MAQCFAKGGWPMLFIIALGCIIGGLVICFLSSSAGPTLGKILWVVGIVVIIVGLILLLTPALVWCDKQLRDALQIH
jgi:hypothetical protein